jgi:hypothetical protein
MKKRRSSKNRLALAPEYRFDNARSRPNRFARKEEIEAAAARLWAAEAERRDREWDARSGVAKPAREVLRKARAKLS